MQLTFDIARKMVPGRPEDGHKGTFGHLLVLGGARGFTGAVKLVSMAAARSGTGLVTAGIPQSLADVVATGLLEVMTHPLPGTQAETFAEEAIEPALVLAQDKQAVVLGPGLSRHTETMHFVHGIVRRCPCPLLVDADGLNALADDPGILRDAASAVVVTPHPGEMARLCGLGTSEIQADREGIARDFASRYRCTVVLKGKGTVVAFPDEEARHYVNTSGNDGLATGGTGDVLSGIIGGLLAQGMARDDAAALGVFIHGRAGDIACASKTARGMIAGDVIEALPTAWYELEQG